MRQWVRRGIISALLLSLAAFLIVFIRLDDEALHQRVITQLEQTTGRTVHGEKARLSLQHGVSLKLAKLRIDGDGDWWLAADVVRFDISPWALLFGELRLTAIDMVHPVLHLDKAIPPKQLFAMPVAVRLLQDTAIFSFRQGQILLRDVVVADEVAATVRRIEREQQTTWELQSRYAGGDFSSQGYIRSFNAGEDKVFGRISATQLRIDQLHGLPLPSLHYDLLDASLTFSLEDGGEWQWFGNLLTRDEHGELPELSWRGKAIGYSSDDFQLHDAFVRFGDKTRLVLLGGCESKQPCQVGIDTQGANPALILKALAIDVPLSGKLDGRVDLKQEKQGWRLDGKLGLRNMKWASVGLPDTMIEFGDLHMDALNYFRLKHAYIQPAGGKGSIEVSQLQQLGEKLNVTVRLNRLDDTWSPLGDILLKQSGLVVNSGKGDKVSGKGVLSGSMEWESVADQSTLQFSLDAAEASIAYGKSFAKPSGLAAAMDGNYRRYEGQSRLEVSDLQLGESRVGKMKLMLSDKVPDLSFAGALVDLSSLKSQGVVLPGELSGWKGMLEGGLEHVALSSDAGMRQWLGAANGSLHLKGFGRDGEMWSGDISLRHGKVLTKQMNWQHGSSFADFDADVNLSSLKGKLNISRSSFAWLPEASLPAWLGNSDIKGRFRQTDVQWNGNIWKGMQGGYLARKGRIELDHVRGKLADGSVQSRNMLLEGVSGGVRFSGRAGMAGVNLNKLEGLADVVGAKMDGLAFLNSAFSGTLPLGLKGVEASGWRGNGDIEIHQGRWKEARAAHLVQWKNEAAAKLEGDAGEGFDRISTRFNISDTGLQLRRLKFINRKLSANGEAMVSPMGDISGSLDVRQGDIQHETALSGRWPSLANLFSQP
ncbi:MAG: hypothetical protein COW19_02070 [Zetaproteobacteria bacterium CG12_big_fil_rev_8_21_14_0_65_55_1124]|nr:MAG: hypothetical protein AUJ58_10195 [Zetaproteobacteria bacterium CG1_02_55_237]PIS19929.1 MAG: hypothetical protein COT53_02740 [Zetaproteobacteria bacterium CG08_land_8_20_14_0_20_55_17]PIW43648.1 MAG: hypothetical protein COW19_02070 [Zetaproteobacteria bacterium CG12_big_fil_rev_8_21_14_0_65_55_1124]PIY52683.1 MAG: hypothetical protein COZ01_06515 [Zetaproteobacteria bacterium CG_4_10_14_0_8_um_filter_55_43]PIZ37867.1 MAG: hypothetical protein COY36_07855 [Zetaproteobacteria bacterium 